MERGWGFVMWTTKELPGGRYKLVEVEAERSGPGWVIDGLLFVHDMELGKKFFGETKESAIAARIAHLDALIDATEFVLGLYKESRDELRIML
jgi:hypothetical protein